MADGEADGEDFFDFRDGEADAITGEDDFGLCGGEAGGVFCGLGVGVLFCGGWGFAEGVEVGDALLFEPGGEAVRFHGVEGVFFIFRVFYDGAVLGVFEVEAGGCFF